MIADNIYYSLTVESGLQYLTNKIVGVDTLKIEVFLYTDTYKTNAILSEELDGSEKYEIILTTNARYVVVITHSLGEDEYEYPYYPYFEEQVIQYIQSFLCNCTAELSVNGCTGCQEHEDMDDFSFLTYIYSHIFLFTDQVKMSDFSTYMNSGLKQYEAQLYQIFNDMFWLNKIEGNYVFNIRTLQIYYTLMYIYFYEQDILEDTDSDYVDEKYDIETVRVCIEKIGLSFQNIVDIFIDESTYAKIYNGDLTGVVTPCTDIAGILINPTIKKSEFELGVDITLVNVENIILITPKLWGTLTEILDNGGANLITDTTRTECGDYYFYTFNYQFPPNVYTFKIVI